MSKICVLGLGYIGLPTASMLASAGHDVVGCDINAAIVASINSGKSHFDEPDLEIAGISGTSAGALNGCRRGSGGQPVPVVSTADRGSVVDALGERAAVE